MQGEVCDAANTAEAAQTGHKKSVFDLPCSAVTDATSRSVRSDKALQRLEKVRSARFRMRGTLLIGSFVLAEGGECSAYPCILVSEKIMLARREP